VDGSITEAARLLGVNSNYLHRLLRNLDLRLGVEEKQQGLVSGYKRRGQAQKGLPSG